MLMKKLRARNLLEYALRLSRRGFGMSAQNAFHNTEVAVKPKQTIMNC